MTRVFIYHNAADRIAAAASLIGKVVAQKKALIVYAPDGEVAAALDRHLWTHPPTGFVPHVAVDSRLAGETPVLIADRVRFTAREFWEKMGFTANAEGNWEYRRHPLR